jgi:hypothetical protein
VVKPSVLKLPETPCNSMVKIPKCPKRLSGKREVNATSLYRPRSQSPKSSQKPDKHKKSGLRGKRFLPKNYFTKAEVFKNNRNRINYE